MDFAARDALVDDDPGTYYLKEHYVNYPCVLVRLSRVRADALGNLITGAHRFVRAPRRGGSLSPAAAGDRFGNHMVAEDPLRATRPSRLRSCRRSKKKCSSSSGQTGRIRACRHWQQDAASGPRTTGGRERLEALLAEFERDAPHGSPVAEAHRPPPVRSCASMRRLSSEPVPAGRGCSGSQIRNRRRDRRSGKTREVLTREW